MYSIRQMKLRAQLEQSIILQNCSLFRKTTLRWFFLPTLLQIKSPWPYSRWCQKDPSPYQFFTCHFYKRSFNPFVTLAQNYKVIPTASPKLLNLNQDHPSKKLVSWSNPYKIDVMITSLIEMLELPNLGHMTTSTI